jgi:uncharacterized SAM-binding protein YcdF (DUF218 family)
MVRRGPLRWLLGAVVAVVAVGVVYVGVGVVGVWRAANTDAVVPGESYDAIVVLGAAQWDGQPSPVFSRRLDHAAGLFGDGVAGHIVVTGGKQEGDRVTQGLAAYDYLRAAGVPDEALLVEVDGTDTYTELAATANILRTQGLGERVVPVTDGYHAHRTALVAREVGLEPAVSPATSGVDLPRLSREGAGVAAGRIVGFRRLSNWL